jgi:hypothetical protein
MRQRTSESSCGRSRKATFTTYRWAQQNSSVAHLMLFLDLLIYNRALKQLLQNAPPILLHHRRAEAAACDDARGKLQKKNYTRRSMVATEFQ